MRTVRSALVAVAALLAVSLLSGSFAPAFASGHRVSTDTLTVKVTYNSGVVWGSVVVKYKSGHSMKKLGYCGAAKCVMHAPHMAKLTFYETPKFPTTWPFTKWNVANGKTKPYTSKHSSISLVISGGKATVDANYYPKA